MLQFYNHAVQVHILIFRSDDILLIHIYVSQTLNEQRQCAKVTEENHHLSQSRGGVLWFFTKLSKL